MIFISDKEDKYTLGILLTLIPIGIYTKFYNGPFHIWVNDSLGGVFYEIFWIACLSLFIKRWPHTVITAAVFCTTTALEFMQLVHHPVLESVRATFLGQALIGNSFNFTDIYYYLIGCIIGWYALHVIYRFTNRPTGTDE